LHLGADYQQEFEIEGFFEGFLPHVLFEASALERDLSGAVPSILLSVRLIELVDGVPRAL
jgi:hypothetical protein